MPIANIHKIEQPREKIQKYGVDKLSDVELLAVLLRTGPKGAGVLKLSKEIFQQYRENQLAQASVHELKAVYGIGSAKACEIAACFELGRRLLKDKKSVLVISPQQVWEELKDIREYKKEYFVIFFLDTQNQVIKREIISMGTLNASLIHPREVFEPAIKYLASHVVLAHNHPSGSLSPSDEDILVTQRLIEAGRILGIEVLDHVVITKQGFTSFKQQNLL